jgi:8-oxo-dGTP pyrophosphatase MutT (NUDIX family)
MILQRLAATTLPVGQPGSRAPGVRYGPTAAALRARGDHDLNAGTPPPPEKTLTAAAVLVPLIDRGHLTVLLTQRTAHLDAHAGQISFPGGRVEPEDLDHVEAALRETEEEVGIPRAQVKVIGRLDDYITGTGFRVAPVVGVVSTPFEVKADPFEVAEVFEVPLAFVLDPANHEQHSRIVNGIERRYYVLPYEGRYIWGATAGMLINLYEVLRG